MPTFQNPNFLDLLGVSALARVTDEEIWKHLVTPSVKGLLGAIVSSEPAQALDTVRGFFSGYAVTNLNGHKLADEHGKLTSDRVRFPYVSSIYRTQNGAVVFMRDGLKFEVMCWYGDVDRGRGELIFKAGMRDRRFDGTRRANDCALLDYTYDNPVYHKRLSAELSSVELSIYGYLPGSRIADACGDEEFERFVGNPFKFMDDPEKFMRFFNQAFRSKRGPGQHFAPIQDVSKLIIPGFEHLARKYGYDIIELAASHSHVAKWAQTNGYRYSVPGQAAMLQQMHDGLERIRANGTPLTRTQQSWVCTLQSLRPVELIPAHLYMGHPQLRWPQDNVGDECLWLYKTISSKAQNFVPPALQNADSNLNSHSGKVA
jgi:hypothetical protein